MQNLTIDCNRTELGTTEPVSLTEAKTHLRVTFTDDDTEITALIRRARRAIEDYCNISIVGYRIAWLVDMYCPWQLPYGPAIGIEAVETPLAVQGSGPVSYETSEMDWLLDRGNFIPEDSNRYQITYTAGMGTNVPDTLKQAIVAQVTWLYENRGKSGANGLCDMAKDLANPYKILLWI